MGSIIKVLVSYFLIYVIKHSTVNGTYYGHYYSNPFLQAPQSVFSRQTYYYPQSTQNSRYASKQIKAVSPVSPVYDVEIIKPMAQMEEKKSVPLYVIPQNSLHIFPHKQGSPLRYRQPLQYFKPSTIDVSQFLGDPSHLPAIEIPLEEPMILQTPESQALAPAGFTVMFKNLYGTLQPYPVYTSVLLATVPVGTVISPETPVIINRIYALPKLPAYPSYFPVFTDYPVPVTNNQITAQNRTSKIHGERFTTTTIPTTRIPTRKENTYPALIQVSTPETVVIEAGQDIVPEIGEINQQLDVSGPDTTTRVPFINSKESPYLQELRIESLTRQISELQAQLNALRRIRN